MKMLVVRRTRIIALKEKILKGNLDNAFQNIRRNGAAKTIQKYIRNHILLKGFIFL